jgi:hypothetical protein
MLTAVFGFVPDMPVHTSALLIVILFAAALFHLRYNDRVVSQGPTLLTTLGIFGTFVGIAVGLLDFRADNIEASIPALLGGMKTAFFASVVGVFGALTIKVRHFAFDGQKLDPAGVPYDVTGHDLAALLKSIQQALVGSEESTLISQMKLGRQDANDRLDALKDAQRESLQKLSEMGSKALVEALRDVIRDFNNKITEQFGENFKQLNEAVARLLSWQEEYKAHLEIAAGRHDQVVRSMAVASTRYEELVTSGGEFVRVAQALKNGIDAADSQQRNLATVLTELTGLLTAASGSLPQVEAKIVDLAHQLSNSLTKNQELMTQSYKENATAIRNSLQSSAQSMIATAEDFNKQMLEMANKTREQVSRLDAALSEELTKSLESLGRQLATLSERFVADYAPLTERLRRVVELAAAA